MINAEKNQEYQDKSPTLKIKWPFRKYRAVLSQKIQIQLLFVKA